LRRISERIGAAKAQGGPIGAVKRAGHVASAALTLGRLFFMRPQRHELPAEIRVAPAW
jgi:magnesium-protoporphyrin IX monomethyl ester (oxidative) cyclase